MLINLRPSTFFWFIPPSFTYTPVQWVILVQQFIFGRTFSGGIQTNLGPESIFNFKIWGVNQDGRQDSLKNQS